MPNAGTYAYSLIDLKCLLNLVDILFLFAVFFFPLTVKLIFILDHASSFHFVIPRNTMHTGHWVWGASKQDTGE